MNKFMLNFFMAGALVAWGILGTQPIAQAKDHSPSKEQAMETKKMKDLANNAFDALFKDYSEEFLRKNIVADYIQHNPILATGLEPLIQLLPALKESGVKHTNHRVLRDGDFVAVHTSYTNAQIFGHDKVAAFNIYRMKDYKIVEHWEVNAPIVEKTASGRTQVDGATEITDLDKTAATKP